MPIQASLFQLCETAGHRLRAENRQQLTPEDVRVEIGLLHDPAVHGSVADPDLAGVDPRRRALLVSQGSRSAWVLDPGRSAEELLELARQQAEISVPESASIHSFLVQATTTPMVVTNVPRAARGPRVRPPAVAGMFYPQQADELSHMLGQLVPESSVAPTAVEGRPRAARRMGLFRENCRRCAATH